MKISGNSNHANEVLVSSNGRICWPGGSPLHGFELDAGGLPSGKLTQLGISRSLLAPVATTEITYICNLPAQTAHYAGLDCILDNRGGFADSIARGDEIGFLALSLPGGQTVVFDSEGKRHVVALRWVCVTADGSIGAIWKCYVQTRSEARRGLWTALDQTYIFDSAGFLQSPTVAHSTPSTVHRNLNIGGIGGVRVNHGTLTQFPTTSKLVKITHLQPNGRAKRNVVRAEVSNNGSVTVYFSDWTSKLVGIAAPTASSLSAAA